MFGKTVVKNLIFFLVLCGLVFTQMIPNVAPVLKNFTTVTLSKTNLRLEVSAKNSAAGDYASSAGDTNIGFYYWTLVGDGSMTMKIGKTISQDASEIEVDSSSTPFKTSTSSAEKIMVALMVREVVTNGGDFAKTKSKSIGFMVHNAYSNDANIRVVDRGSANSWTNQNLRAPTMTDRYFGYLKLQKSGIYFSAWVSDDERTHIIGKFLFDSLFDRGIALQPGTSVSETIDVSEIKFYGFETSTTCSSNEYFAYGTTNYTGCKTIPVYNECGNNQWRNNIISTRNFAGSLRSKIPRLQIETNYIKMTGPGLPPNIAGEGYGSFYFTHKKVSGSGIIIANVSVSSPDENPSGVAIRAKLSNTVKGTSSYEPKVALCQFSNGIDATFYYRTSQNGNFQVDTATSAGVITFVKLEKNGNSFSCYYSIDGTNYIQVGSSYEIIMSRNFYVGISSGAFNSTVSGTSQFENIDITGFSGYCNNHGDCKTVGGELDKCVCESGYSGTYCETPIYTCFEKAHNATDVCTAHGTCTKQDTCVCINSWGGENCELPKCNGILSNSSSVCSGHGTCTDVDVCTCNGGYTGGECQTPVCFDLAATHPDVCNHQNGTCISPDTCSCTDDWDGAECKTPKCNSLIDPVACSGENGTCSFPGSCSCIAGHTGNQCQHFICNGKPSNENTVCSEHGTCQSPDVCVCSTGYTGNDCQNVICYGKINPSACSSENGTCVGINSCSCTTGHTGNECEYNLCNGVSSNSASVCSSHGACVSPDTCICQTGWTGNICQTPVCDNKINPEACSGGNGTCVNPNSCDCATGFTGSNCEFPQCFAKDSTNPLVCNARGRCIAPNTCICDAGYEGNACENQICYGIVSTDSSVCSGNGTCPSPNTCVCSAGYVGNQCEIYICNGKLSNDSTVCSSHGNCIGKEQCYCNSGYTGTNCEYNICDGTSSNVGSVCNSHGTCTAPETCNCISGWTGTYCQTHTCVDRNSCSGHGSCDGPNDCNCNSQYDGSNCSYPICYGVSASSSQVCSGHGRCDSPDNCVCTISGYSGTYCNTTVCTDIDDCNNNGLCVGANDCSCFAGWQGQNCSVFNCNNVNNCSYPKGTCKGPNECQCTAQWSGSNCTNPVCFTKSSTDPNVCSQHGSCVSPDVCSCNAGWTGSQCENAICNSIVATQPNVCNSRGSCPLPNNCTCNQFFDGLDCEFIICNGVSNKLDSVCSSHGLCDSPNNCVCTAGEYDGSNCQYPICYGFASNLANSCTSATRGTCSSPDNCVCNTGYAGDKCENNICFGIASNFTNVCSKHGICSAPNTCDCFPSYYGDNCEFSDLYDFVNKVCDTGNGCTFDKTIYQTATDAGPAGYCNLNIGGSIVTCDGSNRITGMKFPGLGFSGVFPNMLNFTSLTDLDLSLNHFTSIDNLSTYFPSTIQNLNISYNQISNNQNNYNIFVSYFTNFKALIMDGNKGCGIYPSTWLTNKFVISTLNHEKSTWCDKLDLNACTKVVLNENLFVMLPHETKVYLNYTVDSCAQMLNKPSIRCQSTKTDYSSTTVFSKESASLIDKNIVCSRTQFLSDIDQYLTMAWEYNSTLKETISTNLHLVNLPYANILNIDRHLIRSENTGNQIVTITTNQNITRYRKYPSQIAKCGIFSDNYFVTASSVSADGKSVSCSLQLSAPNTGIKTIFLYESNEVEKITTNSISFWLINTKIEVPEIFNSYIGNIGLKDKNGALLPGKVGYPYALNNTQYSINFQCLFSSNKIQYCSKNSITVLPKDIMEIPLTLYDGNVVIDTIDTLFYRKNKIVTIYPQAILTETPKDVFITFNTSTFDTTIVGLKSYCVFQNGNYSGEIINTTTIKCLSVQNQNSFTFNFNVHVVYKNFEMVINEEMVEFFTIKPNSIYPSESVTGLNGTRTFQFSNTESISILLKDSLQCQLEDGTIIGATRLDSNEFTCVINSAIHRNLTFWMIDTMGIRSQLSSNLISLFFFNFGEISYESSSKQFGNTDITLTPVVKLNVANVPQIYQSRVHCNFDNNYVTTTITSLDTYQCTVSSTIGGYKSIGIKYNKINAFKVKNIHNTFKNKLSLTYKTGTTKLNTARYLKVTHDTQSLINSGELKADCSDFVIVYNGNELPRKIDSCNSASTEFKFKVQKMESGNVVGYEIYYGNNVATAILDTETGGSHSFTPTVQSPDEVVLTLNSNFLSFGFLKQFTISKIDPVGALVTNSTVKITNTYLNVNYNGLVRWETRYDGSSFDAIYATSLFQSNIYATAGKKIQIGLWAVYIPTGESTQASSNTLEFIFMDLVQTNYLYPFIDRFSGSNQNKKPTIQITTDSSLFTDSGLKCRYIHNGVQKLSKASFVTGNTKLVQCKIDVTLNLKSEFISFDLYMDASSDTNLNFILTSNNLTYVYLKEPVEILIPSTITTQYFYQNFSLDFSNPQLIPSTKISYNSYKVKLIPEYSTTNPTKYLSCNFDKQLQPECMIQDLSLTHTPMRLDYQMEVTSPHFGDVVTFSMTSNIFKSNVSILTELPYVGDAITHQSTSLIVEFNVTKKLHPSYSFYCYIYGNKVPIVRTSEENIFKCSFKSRGIEEVVPISLYIDNVAIPGLGGIISFEDSTVQMVILEFSPSYLTFDGSQTLSIRKNNSATFIVPSTYRGYGHQIVSTSSSDFSCSIGAGNGLISCSKTTIPYQGVADIFLLNFKMEYKKYSTSNFGELVQIRKDLILKENHEITDIFPLAAINGTDMHIVLEFDGRALLNTLDDKISFYCQFNQNKTLTTPLTDRKVNCSVKYDVHKSDMIQFQSYFRIPSITNEDIYITTVDSATKFHYLYQSNISFSNVDQIQFFYTSKMSMFNIDISTFIPQSLRGKITGKLSDLSGFAPENAFVASTGNLNQFQVNTSTTEGGKKQLTLWYKENDYNFQLSTNHLEVIFAIPSLINGINPIISVVNRTTRVTISTVFDTTLDYGAANFTCKYGPNETRYRNVSVAEVIHNVEEKVYVSIWMTTKGTERKITIVDEAFYFITTDFLSPSHGLISGNENVQVLDYKRVPSNVSYIDEYLNQDFICEKLNLTLQCITPTNSTGILRFNSYVLKYTAAELLQRRLALEWIVYDKRELSDFYPQVISSDDPTFPINITFDDEITITTGELILVFGLGTNYREDFSFGDIKNKINVQKDITPLDTSDKKGTHAIQLFYKHPESVEFRNMIPISQSKNITILLKSSIEFVTGTNNIGYVGELTNFTILLKDDVLLEDEQKPRVQCRIGSTFVKTYYDASNPRVYICSTSSSIEMVDVVSLWYKDIKAYNGAVKVSSNLLDVLLVNFIDVTNTAPFASLTKTQGILLNTSLSQDFYTSKVTYECHFDGKVTPATLIQNTFNCTISTEKSNSFFNYVTINVVSQITGISIPLAKKHNVNSEFYFLNQISTLSMFPFSLGHEKTAGFLDSDVSLKIASDLILTREIYCQYKSNDGIFLSKAEYTGNSNSTLSCKIHKQSFTNVVEIITVSLWMNATGNSTFDITPDNQMFLFIREPLYWNSSKLLNEISIWQTNFLQYRNPNGNFDYKLNMTPTVDSSITTTLDCNFTGDYPSCQMNQYNLDTVTSLPSNLNFTFHIYHKTSGLISQAFKVDYLTHFYSNMTIERLKPYFFSFYEREYDPVRLISNVNTELNYKRFVFKCKYTLTGSAETSSSIALFDTKTSEYELGVSNTTHFVCPFTSFGTPNSNTDSFLYTMKLYFVSEFGDIELTQNSAKISGVVKSVPLSPTFGISLGDFSISQTIGRYPIPTDFYSGYDYSIKLYLSTGNQTNLVCNHASGLVTCQFPAIHDTFESWNSPRKFLLDLWMNNQYSMKLVPYFTVYPYISVTDISPSIYFKTDQTSEVILTILPYEFTGAEIKFNLLQGTTGKTEICKLASSTSLVCGIPSITTAGEYDMKVSINNGKEQDLGKTLMFYEENSINITNVSNLTLSYIQYNNLIIEGNGFINNSNIVVIIFDNFIRRISKGRYIDSNHIFAEFPPFYDLSINFPRQLFVKVSFDNGNNFIISSFSMKVSRYSEYSTWPSKIPLGIKTDGIKLIGFPMNDIHLNSTEKLGFRFYKNSTYFVSANCSTIGICKLDTSPQATGKYTLNIGLINQDNDWIIINIYASNQIEVYDYQETAITSIEPKTILIQNTTNPVVLVGNFKSFKSALFRITYFKDALFALPSVTFSSGTITDTSASIPITVSDVNRIQIEVTFNDGINYHDIHTYETIKPSFRLSSVLPEVTEEIQNLKNFLIDKELSTLLTGENFDINATRSDVQFILKSSKGIFNITEQSKYEIVSSTLIKFISPKLETLNIGYDVDFPFELNLGVSFNNGHDYEYIKFVYVDQFPQPVLTGIIPAFTVRKDLNISVFGLNLGLGKNCSVYENKGSAISGMEIYEVEPVVSFSLFSNASTSVICQIPYNLTQNRSSVYVTMKNVQHEINSDGYSLEFYKAPTLLDIEPKSGPTFGGIQIVISGKGIVATRASAPNIYCKFGRIVSDKPCNRKDDEQVICDVQTHPPGKVDFSLSYNKVDWHYVNSTQFQYTTCGAGYSSADYKSPCELCPPGTYKPTIGSYECINCENGTYNSFSGSTYCEKCPANTTGLVTKATSHKDCLCDEGFYVNTQYYDHSGAHKKCITCPEGAFCPFNTTEPLALPGYFNFKTNFVNFYSCLPKISCGGFSPQNCTEGYTGVRCGRCVDSCVKAVPWDVDYIYKPMNFQTDSETPEENFSSMNDIFNDLLSWNRIQRRLFFIKRKGLKSSNKIITKLKQKTEKEKQVEEYLKKLRKDDVEFQKTINKYKAENGGVLTKEMERKLEKLELKKRKAEFEKKLEDGDESPTGELDFTFETEEKVVDTKQRSGTLFQKIDILDFEKTSEQKKKEEELKKKEEEKLKKKDLVGKVAKVNTKVFVDNSKLKHKEIKPKSSTYAIRSQDLELIKKKKTKEELEAERIKEEEEKMKRRKIEEQEFQESITKYKADHEGNVSEDVKKFENLFMKKSKEKKPTDENAFVEEEVYDEPPQKVMEVEKEVEEEVEYFTQNNRSNTMEIKFGDGSDSSSEEEEKKKKPKKKTFVKTIKKKKK
eukprot:gene3782-6943_t